MVIIRWIQNKSSLLLKQRIIYTKMMNKQYTLSLELYIVVWITCFVFTVIGDLPAVSSKSFTGLTPEQVVHSMFVETYVDFLNQVRVPSPLLFANFSSDISTTPTCGVITPLVGSLKCLEEFTDARGVRPKYSDFIPQLCNESTIYFPCGEDATVPETDFRGGIDPETTVDSDADTMMAWPVESGKTVSLTYSFSEVFKILVVALRVQSVPIEITITGSEGDNPEHLLKRFQLGECAEDDALCAPNPDYGDKVAQSRVMFVDLDRDLDELVDDWPDLDKITLTFPDLTTWSEYSISHIVIEDVELFASCACKNGGSCSTTIDETSERSRLAKYSCACPTSLAGFMCEECAEGYYRSSDDGEELECSDCACGSGSSDINCSSDGTCMCDKKFYDSKEAWDSKCQESYISDITPLSGAVTGGTIVTITGGLLTDLTFQNCETIECTKQSGCLDSNAELFCKITAGTELSTFTLIEAMTAERVTKSYQFTYKEPAKISDIQPTESFASGGRRITVTGENLDTPQKIELIYTVTCVEESEGDMELSVPCLVSTSTEAYCASANFCEQQNMCTRKSGVPEDNCRDDNDNSIANNPNDVNIQMSLQVDSLPSQTNISFTILPNPVIIQWQNKMLKIEKSEDTFMVPGQNMTSGAVASDYKVTIGGVAAVPRFVNETRLMVEWPESQPEGETIVKLGEGEVSQTVGNLLVDEVDILAIILPVVIVLVLAVILAVVLITLRRKRRRQREKNLQKMAYKPGNVRYVKQNGESGVIPLGFLVKDIELIEQLKPFLIDKQNLSLQTQIGGGQFGKVYRGTLRFNDGKELTVAAKTLKADFTMTEEMVTSFLKEATLMSNFNHANVLDLIGVVYADGHMPVVVLPFMSRGDIRALIHKENEVFVLGDLLHFAMQIGRGMEYLSGRRFIHRDLAARNCMVDENYMVKIADFGLSHDIYEDDYYRTDANSNRPLPVKWMALESLNGGKYTTESDVWSYGIVMWELLTRGITPYPSVSNYDIKGHLKSGERLEKPEHCPDIIYDMMKSCWETEPDMRPKFAELADKLETILEQSNYQDRSKTGEIESDYYRETVDKSDLQELYVEVLE